VIKEFFKQNIGKVAIVVAATVITTGGAYLVYAQDPQTNLSSPIAPSLSPQINKSSVLAKATEVTPSPSPSYRPSIDPLSTTPHPTTSSSPSPTPTSESKTPDPTPSPLSKYESNMAKLNSLQPGDYCTDPLYAHLFNPSLACEPGKQPHPYIQAWNECILKNGASKGWEKAREECLHTIDL